LVTLLAGLAAEGYVTRDERSLYRIGPAGFSLAARITGGIKLPGLVRPALQRLMEATGETALAGVLSPSEDSVVYIEKAESTNPMRYTVPVGEHRELHCTALGKLALAFMGREQLARCLERLQLQAATNTTITDQPNLLATLEQIRAQGISTTQDERIVGASAIAAALVRPDGRFIAGLAVIGPTARIQPRLEQFTAAVANEARALSQLIASAPTAFNKPTNGD
jgi:DNA-binding IclR family transcriptional regulator